jgi:hypothetical protein
VAAAGGCVKTELIEYRAIFEPWTPQGHNSFAIVQAVDAESLRLFPGYEKLVKAAMQHAIDDFVKRHRVRVIRQKWSRAVWTTDWGGGDAEVSNRERRES